MKSIRDIYKIGKGPSSSHTMGPAKAMSIYVSEHPEAESYRVVLFGSLADTGEVSQNKDHIVLYPFNLNKELEVEGEVTYLLNTIVPQCPQFSI